VNGTTIHDTNNNVRVDILRILSYGTACFGLSVSWCSFAADYNTYFPEDTSQLKIFLLTYMGNFVSIIPLELLGAALYTGTYTNQNWSHAYETNNVGGLLGASLSPLGGFGKFLLVLFALSTVACNIPNIYSLSLSAQVIAPIFKHVPRILYTVIGTVIYIALGIAAAYRFNDSLTAFMDIISYWFSIFIVIVFEDHVLFRRCSYKNYDFNIWNKRKFLPISLSAFFSGIVGIIGIILGMSQSWFNGPIAKALIGDTGEQRGDLGFECGLVFTAITFPLFRLIELRFIKR
jgi:purine-cytosine permease-like protein